jgi:hypothetical protein
MYQSALQYLLCTNANDLYFVYLLSLFRSWRLFHTFFIRSTLLADGSYLFTCFTRFTLINIILKTLKHFCSPNFKLTLVISWSLLYFSKPKASLYRLLPQSLSSQPHHPNLSFLSEVSSKNSKLH